MYRSKTAVLVAGNMRAYAVFLRRDRGATKNIVSSHHIIKRIGGYTLYSRPSLNIL